MTNSHHHKPSKLCLKCARRKLAKKTSKPCGDCILLNVDPLAQIRSNAAKPSPKFRYPLLHGFSCSSLATESCSTMPARARGAGRSA